MQIKGITLRNRIGVSPMCQYSSVDGFANDWHLVHYGARATGGSALIIQEATAVSPEGRITPFDLGLWKDEQIDRLRPVTAFIHDQGAVPAVQLAHAGRKAGCAKPTEGGHQLKPGEGGWTNVSASALTFNPIDDVPAMLDAEGIRRMVQNFGEAARRALEAGFRIIDIHAAHGYLIHQFLSPLSNQRTDAYGGSFENRIRFLSEVVKTVRSEWPDELPLFVRISVTDWAEGGWNAEEAVRLATLLKKEGVDLIDCSSGGLVPWQKIPLGPGYQVHLAEKIRKEASVLTSAVGLITGVEQAEEILQKQQADLILMGREMLRNPCFTLQAATLMEESIDWPFQYVRAKM